MYGEVRRVQQKSRGRMTIARDCLLERVLEKGYIQRDWNSLAQADANNSSFRSVPVTWRKK